NRANLVLELDRGAARRQGVESDLDLFGPVQRSAEIDADVGDHRAGFGFLPAAGDRLHPLCPALFDIAQVDHVADVAERIHVAPADGEGELEFRHCGLPVWGGRIVALWRYVR